jgi:Fe2+ transport system protein B
VALLVARLLTATVLKSMETAPFVMELPEYHPPTIFGVGQRAVECTWQYIKRVGTIVVAVSVCILSSFAARESSVATISNAAIRGGLYFSISSMMTSHSSRTYLVRILRIVADAMENRMSVEGSPSNWPGF